MASPEAVDQVVESEVETITDDSAEAADTPDADAVNMAEEAIDTPQETEGSKGGVSAILPLVLGGLVAGGIGLGAGYFLPRSSISMDAVQQGQAQLQGDVDQLRSAYAVLQDAPAPVDHSATIEQITDDLAQLQTDIKRIEVSVTGVAARLDALEDRPLSDQVAPGAVAAFEAEIQRLQDQVTAQVGEIKQIAEAAKAEVIAAKNQAAALELEAIEKAKAGTARSALNAISASIATGGAYESTLAEFAENSDLSVPPILVENAATGFVSLAVLQADFPDYARQALSVARLSADRPEGENGFTSFFKSQLNVRSLTPKEGTDPDAVLSRAENWLAQGDVPNTLRELSALPIDAVAVFKPWTDAANNRMQAQTEVADLLAHLPKS